MPIQPINFPMPSFEQNNPMLAGAKYGMGLVGQNQDMLSKMLAQKKSQAELPYAADMAKATSAYKTAMANYLTSPNQMLRYMSPLGKTFVEPGVVNAVFQKYGMKPPGNQPVEGFEYNPPDNQAGNRGENTSSGMEDSYALQRQKMTSDSQARQKNLYATNIEKTLGYIDPDDLTKYAGFEGGLKQLYEKSKVGFGKESPEYDKYRTSLTAAQFLAKQVRQFYGDSIQPAMEEKLTRITNPSEWFSNPTLAKKTFLQTKELLGKELVTYRQALKSTKAYQEQPNDLNEVNHSQEVSEEIPNKKSTYKNTLEKQLKESKPAKEEGLAQYSARVGQEGVIEDIKKIRGKSFHKINGKWFQVEGE